MSAVPSAGNAPRFMLIFGAVAVAAILLYYVFMAVDGSGLAQSGGTAQVVGKEFREAGTTYAPQKIGNAVRSIPQAKEAMYILELDIEGTLTKGPVEKDLYDAVDEGEIVDVTYRKRRIMGTLEVVSVRRR